MNGLDLRVDAATARNFVAASVQRFASRFPGEAVTGLELFFSLENGFLRVSYWTNADYDPFYYDITNARFEETLEIPEWEAFWELWFEKPTQSVDVDGSTISTEPGVDERYGMRQAENGVDVMEAIGRMLVGLLMAARRDGLFTGISLPGLPRFGVQADDGFDWEEPATT